MDEEQKHEETTETSDSTVLFNTVVAVAVALIALVGSLITKVQGDAATFSGIATNDEQRYYYQAMGEQISGDANANNEFGTIYQLWHEYDLLTIAAEKSGDTASAEAYQTLRDELAKDSMLLSSEYFNPMSGTVNLPAFQMETYGLKILELEEQQNAAAEVAIAWDDKASAYILQMTLLAVAGFLLGLALMTKSRHARLVFAGSGIPMVVIISVWAYLIWQTPVYDLRQTGAIPHFARGASLVKQKNWAEALPALDRAIALAGDEYLYGRAYLLRAETQAGLGNFEAAIEDYQLAQEAGETAPHVASNLVWAFFQTGQFEKAIEAGQTALEDNPDDLWLQLHTAIAILGARDIKEAESQYRLIMDNAANQVQDKRALGDDPSNIWWQLNEASFQLKTFSNLLNNQKAESPVKEAVNDSDAVAQAAQEIAALLDERSVALQYEIETSDISARINPFNFNLISSEDRGFVYSISMDILYAGVEPGSLFTVKVARNGVEDPSWTQNLVWDRSVTGEVTLLLTPTYADIYIVPSGRYQVTIYVNGRRVQQGEFVVGDEKSFEGSDTFTDMLAGFDFFDLDIFNTELSENEFTEEDFDEYDLYDFYEATEDSDFENHAEDYDDHQETSEILSEDDSDTDSAEENTPETDSTDESNEGDEGEGGEEPPP